MIHELRIYHCLPNRLPALLKRFDTVTLKIWEQATASARPASGRRWSARPTTRCTTSSPGNSLAEREDKWNRFAVDPEWVAARTASEADGPILERVENCFLQPTAFSAVK